MYATDGDVEVTGGPTAAGPARTFPESWGAPPGARYSETRAAWVKSHVRQEMVGGPLRELERRDVAFLNMLRVCLVARMKDGPT